MASRQPPFAGDNEGPAEDLTHALRLILILRVVIVTALLGSALYVQIFFGLTSDSLYFIIGLTYLLTVFYAVLAVPFRSSRLFAFSQLLIDVALVSLLVLVTGAADSAFIIIYYLLVVSAAIILGRISSFALATVAGALLAAVVMVANGGLVDLRILYPYARPALNTMLYTIALHLVALELLAALSGYLAGMVQTTAARLRQRTADLARLRVLNESIVRSIHSGIITTDMDGRITFANLRALELLQTEPDGIIGRDVRKLLHYNPSGSQPILSDEGWHREMLLERADGERIDIGVSRTLLLDPEGMLMGKLYAVDDMREIKALQARLSLQDRMAAAGELSAAIAHEIRNPLGSISGSAQMIRKSPDLSEDVLYYMDIIVRESQRLSKILNDFLTFTRAPAFNPVNVDLLKVAREIVDLLTHSTDVSAAHQIELHSGGRDTLVARADANMVRQLIYNLAANGVRAMPNGGKLSIAVDRDGGAAVIKFTDNGHGIPPDRLQKLFQPFVSGSRGGVGLGMAIVYKIVREHGGSISVRSKQGVGTSVTVRLPIKGGDQSGFSVQVATAEP
jgi:two-component system sensor histidine kinase PilS (NtrC family)